MMQSLSLNSPHMIDKCQSYDAKFDRLWRLSHVKSSVNQAKFGMKSALHVQDYTEKRKWLEGQLSKLEAKLA